MVPIPPDVDLPIATNGDAPQPTDGFDDSSARVDGEPKKVGDILRSFVGLVSWCLLGFVVVALLARSSNASNRPTIVIASILTFAAIPLLLALVGSLITRGRTLRLSAGLLASVFLFVTTPVGAVVGCGPSDSAEFADGTADTSGELTILTANLLWTANRPNQVAEMILETNPDIVALQEVSSEVFAALAANPDLVEYIYKDFVETNAAFATATLAKLPVTPRQLSPGNRRVRTTVFANSRTNPIESEFTLTALHLTAPIRQSDVAKWRGELDSLAQLSVDSPAILVGDFNATENHKPFRNILDAGWTDVHQKKGCGVDATFPTKSKFPIPLVRIDHVLVTDHFEVLSVDVLDRTNGSDHKPVLAKVRRGQSDS